MTAYGDEAFQPLSPPLHERSDQVRYLRFGFSKRCTDETLSSHVLVPPPASVTRARARRHLHETAPARHLIIVLPCRNAVLIFKPPKKLICLLSLHCCLLRAIRGLPFFPSARLVRLLAAVRLLCCIYYAVHRRTIRIAAFNGVAEAL